jgi:hypothetical protein
VSEGETSAEEPRLADSAVLRRVERLGIAWAVLAAGGLWIAGAVAGVPRGGALPAVTLTVVAAASIVAFRGLQRIVSALGPAGPVPAESEPRDSRSWDTRIDSEARVRIQDPEIGVSKEKASEKIGWRQGLTALVRLCLLGALLITGTFLLGPRFFPALALGFSTLPAALMTEGLLQMVRALRRKDHDGVS